MGHKDRSRSRTPDSDDSGNESGDSHHGGSKEDKAARKARRKAEKAAKKHGDGGSEEHSDKKDKKDKEKKSKHQGQFEQWAVEQPPPIPDQHRDAFPATMPPAYNAPSDHSPGHGQASFSGEAASFFSGGGGGGQWQGGQGFPQAPQQERSWNVPQGRPQPSHSPSYPSQAPPPSGFRIPLSTGQPFPSGAQAGQPPFRDLDGSPVFVGSALFENPSSVHPCKIVPGLNPPVRVPFGGGEHEHNGRFDLLPFLPDQMEWVRASGGATPSGRRPIEGGYENGGGRLFHGYAEIRGVGVPGKVGEHLGGLNVAFGGQEVAITRDYYILCWR